MLAGAIALALTAAVPAMAATARPARPAFVNAQVENIESALDLDNHGGHNTPVIMAQGGSLYSTTNCQGWTDPGGTRQTVCHLKDSTGQYLDASPSTGQVYSESYANILEEDFCTSCGPGGGGTWYINAYWSGVAHQRDYMTEDGPNPGDPVNANVGPGFGNAAVWRP